MNIEREIRFYLPLERLKSLKTTLQQFQHWGRFYEITIMYDNPNPEYTFYSPTIDGRLRLRVATPTEKKFKNGYGLLSWKQRIPKFKNDAIRHEHEIEFNFNPVELQSVRSILENILHCPKISSYERYRSHYKNENIHITLDEFPFGLMLEFEINHSTRNEKQKILEILCKFGLIYRNASHYSCDDMYRELCFKENKKPKPDILFNDPDMPKIRNG